MCARAACGGILRGCSTVQYPVSVGSHVTLPSDARIDVAFTGAFVTNVSLRVDGFSQAQIEASQLDLVRVLNDSTVGDIWQPCIAAPSRDGRRYAGEAFESLRPSALLEINRREAPRLLGVEETIGCGDEMNAWRTLGARLEVQAHGVGTLVVGARLERTSEEPIDPSDLRSIVRAATDSLVSPLNRAVAGILNPISPMRDLRAQLSEPLWISDVVTAGDGRASASQPSELLWLHPVLFIQGDELRDDVAHLDIVLDQLMEFAYGVARYARLTFVPGTDLSAVIRPFNDGDSRQPLIDDSIVDIFTLQWAHFAALAEMDRSLLTAMSSLTAETASEAQLQAGYRRALRISDGVQVFRAAYASHLADLGAGSISVWNNLAEVSQIHQLEASVRDKLEAIQRVCSRRVSELTAHRERRLGHAIMAFTIISVVSGGASVAAYVIYPSGGGVAVLRFAWVIALAFAAILLVLLSSRVVLRANDVARTEA